MQKHLFRYPWICIAILGVLLTFAALILWLLLKSAPTPAEISDGIQLVREVMRFAAL